MFVGPLDLGMPDGSIKTYKFAWCYPAFLILPEVMLYQADEKIWSINRVPHRLFADLDQLKILDDQYFYNFVLKSYAFMVWRHIEGNNTNYLETYSIDDPIYIIGLRWIRT